MYSSQLSDRFQEAFNFAFQLHKNQIRKGSDVPYITHLMAVAVLVLENGGDEEEAIVALLHDAVEDQGGLKTLDLIRQRFGEKVASIVEKCSDSFSTPKLPWRDRKESHLHCLVGASPAVLRVSLADKLHNLKSLYSAYRRDGEEIWKHFRGGKEGTLWYYHELSKMFHKEGENIMLSDFDQLLDQFDRMVES
ncbi:MAG: phosphohydrolase [Chloroflexi bacterium RBG_16_48_8]|nr:MAG: phosphohydrolase [Chloroflexi bacterium RBG_16_48_8]